MRLTQDEVNFLYMLHISLCFADVVRASLCHGVLCYYRFPRLMSLFQIVCERNALFALGCAVGRAYSSFTRRREVTKQVELSQLNICLLVMIDPFDTR